MPNVAVAADSSASSVVLLVLGVGFAVAVLALLIAALVSIWRSPRLTPSGKGLWILIVLIAQFIGPIVWFAWGRRARGSSLYVD